ncbi:MAG: hypothetical protein A3I24_02225 [Candidatus Harrisonbacteria bacterium RIFCSPLOWO2_02_FULL_41_13b]|uniref:Type II secretion system protein GspG C-terminal domain-containing protein n=1 Tax=Candidatus Harrisonbacteria bacterium RIFCSPLOWO2_02_FULL_41_13b TaxID=1798409 RepID=A0A1G1ZU13_9BACT|nr:MAG: hypothetical protein A3J53_03510 [Candidatus Harrisonbacteria bacterium RIFCSPHIGHO2_02_FULL_40_20]OGY68223.1 MAG: hypothetical protein A3I24_02225 [Candidatus Harrisonbacteria bacterium RIFCSPLOWO2_02_FULL_41_13b]
MKFFIYTIISIVGISVIAGFFIVGSPQEERLRRFDERRVGDLQSIQGELINYWLNKSKLPDALDLLRDDIRGIVMPVDPETGENYTYVVKGPEAFSLCAVFVRPSLGRAQYPENISVEPMRPYLWAGDNWEHDAGPVCFERTIDKDIYVPRKEAVKS